MAVRSTLPRSSRPQPTSERDVSQQHMTATTDAALHGRRAAAWLPVWDKGGRATRVRLLGAFLALHAQSTSEAVAQDLGDAAPLLFARVTSWLRLTYCQLPPPTVTPASLNAMATAAAPAVSAGTAATAGAGRAAAPAKAATNSTLTASPLLLMAQALAVFVRGATYATQLVEAGVAATLTDCLDRGAAGGYRSLTSEEKTAVLLLLLYVANSGRVYREMICDEDGLPRLLRVLRAESDEAVAALLTELFVRLGKGSPQLAPAVQWGLARLIVDHYARKEGGETDADAEADGIRKKGCGGSEGEAVVLEAARALRGLQLHKQTHHFGTCRQQQQQAAASASAGTGMVARGGELDDGPLTASGVPLVDCVPVVCCFPDGIVDQGTSTSTKRTTKDGCQTGDDGLLHPISTHTFLDALFYLALDENTRMCVEGSELLVMAARSAELMPPILSRALDVLDDDMLVIADAPDSELVARRHRRQLSCGRVAVQVVLTVPMSRHRCRVLVDLVALRSAHISLMKYLRLTDLSDSTAVVEGCRALQVLARASNSAQLPAARSSGRVTTGGGDVPMSAVQKMGHAIRDALGADLYEVLLHDTLTVEESFAMLRAARASATTGAVW